MSRAMIPSSTFPQARERAIRALLAEWRVLSTYDALRTSAYGDMSASRRMRELNRRADLLQHVGVAVDRTGEFPASTHDELVSAWERVARPRIERMSRECYRSDTRYTQASLATWSRARKALGL